MQDDKANKSAMYDNHVLANGKEGNKEHDLAMKAASIIAPSSNCLRISNFKVPPSE
jgi:hypothetical protein